MKQRLFSTLTAVIALWSACVSQNVRRPVLVVGIVVEGLSTDYLTLLNDHFLDGGFKRLRTQGLGMTDIDFGSDLDATAATAVIYTGAAPSVNGISARKVYDKKLKAAYHVFHDPSKVGNFTDETYSPAALRVSTLADEVRIDSRGDGVVESVAPSAAEALIMSGHAGNGAFWISDKTGNWASSTYYTDMPNSVSSRNYKTPLSARLDTLVWTPLFDPTLLPGLSEQKRIRGFRHSFQRGDADRYLAFKASARGNTEVTDLAIDIISDMSLGRHNGMDMINVAYTVAPFGYGRSTDSAIESLDAYLRLDRDIARLIRAAETKAGAGNVAVMLAGVPGAQADKRDAEIWRVPYGQFSVKRAESLLNMYLMALHGNGDWIAGYYDRHFYLNEQLIKDKQLNLADLRTQSAEFLSKMSGVAETYTIDDIIAGRAGDDAAALKRNTNVKTAGDIIITIAPGWEVTDDGARRPAVVTRTARPAIPAFIMAPGLQHATLTEPVDARRIAPTMARAIWMRAPNGASLPPIHNGAF